MDSIGFYCAGFPDHRIVDAYLKPTVDDSKEAFSWALPDLDLLREYPWPSNEENKNKSVYIKDYSYMYMYDTLQNGCSSLKYWLVQVKHSNETFCY